MFILKKMIENRRQRIVKVRIETSLPMTLFGRFKG